ncbi:MAG: hypothetical protein N2662_04720, partial [Bacteroidales bacterium]|nr:hypothetical protein [Bacteroidales bacterium]
IPISEGNMGILYSIATYGNTDNNVTMGLGWGFIGEELAKRPVITISGMKRVSRKVGLVTENWIIPADGYKAVFSYGVRFFGEKIAIDLAFYNEKEIAQYLIIGIPYVDFVVKF